MLFQLRDVETLYRGYEYLAPHCYCWSAAVAKVQALSVVEGLVPSLLGIHVIDVF